MRIQKGGVIMGLPIVTQGKVVDKSTSNGVDRNGNNTVYYNLKIFDVRPDHYDSQIIGVPKDVYDAVKIGEDVQLAGEFGGLKNKYWKFDRLKK